MLQGIIFDMDGVLLDTERPHIKIDIDLAAEMGHTLPEALIQQLFGSTSAHIQKLMPQYLGADFDYDTFLRESQRRAEKQFEENGVPVKPGAAALLKAIRGRGIPCGLASSSYGALVRKNMSSTGLLGFFDVIVGGDEAPASKPAPDIFLLAAQKLGLAPTACLAVEDSYNGVRSAAAAGCITAMIPDMLPPDDEMRSLAAVILNSLSGVLDFYDLYNQINSPENTDLTLNIPQ